MSEVKKQHYVPQCYLRNFTFDKDKTYIFCRDLVSGSVFKPNIENIAQQKYFYDFPDQDETNFQIIEKSFSKIEGNYATYLKRLIGNVQSGYLLSPCKNARIITDDLKDAFSLYLSVQYFRTPTHRRAIQDMMIGTVNWMLPHFLEHHAPPPPEGLSIDDIYAEYNEEYAPIHHAEFMFKDETIERFSSLFYNKVWVIGYCTSDSLLYTSDNPVVKHSQFKSPVRGYGLGSPNVEIYFPISSRIVLMLFEEGLYDGHISKEIKEDCIYELPEEYIRYINSMQVYQAQRQVYCEIDDFNLVDEMIKTNPEITSKDKPQIVIN
tara:strand:+ start:181211 stop:182173 length:963 start_codon:yes stop_codon:yes gene_type:complete